MDTISSMLQQAMEGQKQLNTNKPTTTKQMTQLVTNVKPQPTPKSQPVDIKQPLDKMPPSPYAIPKPLTMQQPVTKLMPLVDAPNVRAYPRDQKTFVNQFLQEHDKVFDPLVQLHKHPGLAPILNKPLIAGISAMDLIPRSIPEAVLWSKIPAIGKIGEGVGGLLKSAAWNSTKMGAWNEAVNELHNLTTNKKIGTNAGESLESGAIFGAGGTVFSRVYPFVSKFIRTGATGLATKIYEAFPDTTQKSLEYAFSKAAKWFTPTYALTSQPTKFFDESVNKVLRIHNEAQLASSMAVDYIDNKSVGHLLDTLGEKISPGLNRFGATAYIKMAPDEDIKNLIKTNPEFKDLILDVREKMGLFKNNADAEKAFKENREALRIKRTIAGKPAREFDYNRYLTSSLSFRGALLEKDTPLLQEIETKFNNKEGFYRAYYGSMFNPVVINEFSKIGENLSAKSGDKFVYPIDKNTAVSIASKWMEDVSRPNTKNLDYLYARLKQPTDSALQKDYKNIIAQRLQEMPMAGNYGTLYKRIFNMVEDIYGGHIDYKLLKDDAEALEQSKAIKKEQITLAQKLLHQIYNAPDIKGTTSAEEQQTLEKLFSKADNLLTQEGANKLSPAKQMQFYQDIAIAFHNFGESDIVEDKLVPGLPINQVIDDIHNLADKIQNIKPQRYYFLGGSFKGNISKTIEEYFLPGEYYKNGQFGEGTQNRFFIGLKRLAIGLVPFFHQKSLTFSSIYNTGDMATAYEGFKNMFMDKREFALKMQPLLEKTDNLLREFPGTSTILSGTASTPRVVGGKDILSLSEKLPWVKWGDNRLWYRMHSYYKTNAFANIYDDFTAGKMTREEAVRAIKNTNIFFGGLPEIAKLHPQLRSALRWMFLAPDWELSLVKQLFGGALGLDEDRVRYFYNILYFNMFLNSAVNASRGLQPDTTDWHRVYNAVKNNDVGRLFSQTVSMAGVPVNIDILGYESEMWTLFYSAFEPILQSGAITRGSLSTAWNNFKYHLSTKLSIPMQETAAVVNYLHPQGGQDKSLFQTVLSPFFPYIAKGGLFPKNASNRKAGLGSSVISSFGVRANMETKSEPLVDIMTTHKEYTPETYQAMGKYVNAYIQELAKSKKEPNIAFKDNFYSTLLNRKFSDVIPNYKSLVSQLTTEINNKDQKGVEATAKQFQSYTQRTAQQIYDTIRHSTFFDILQKKVGVEKAKQLTANLAMGILKYAFMRSEQQAAKNQTTSINPNETQPQQNQPQDNSADFSNLPPSVLSQPQAQPQSYSISPTKINNIVQQASAAYGVPAKLIKAVIQAESTNDPNAISNKGAIGLMQTEPQTAQQLGVTDPYDPKQNIMAGTKYLSELIKKYNGNYTLALAAYNAGPNTVDQYGGVPPYTETINYINKVADYYNR